MERLHIVPGFRAAMTLANLRADLQRYAAEEASGPLPGATESGFETAVEFVAEAEASGEYEVHCRIDRHETLDGRFALVVDYKHSAASRINTLVREHEAGERIQGPLYLVGLERGQGLEPGGMVYWGLRGATSIGDWIREGVLPDAAIPDSVEVVSEGALRELLERAEQSAAGLSPICNHSI